MDELSGLEQHDGQAGHSPIFWFTINSYLGKEQKIKKKKKDGKMQNSPSKFHNFSF